MTLKELNIPAFMLTGNITKQQANQIYKQIDSMCNSHSNGNSNNNINNNTPGAIKLLYVTPEKIEKSKMLKSKLERLFKAQKLDRIAIDEVSSSLLYLHYQYD